MSQQSRDIFFFWRIIDNLSYYTWCINDFSKFNFFWAKNQSINQLQAVDGLSAMTKNQSINQSSTSSAWSMSAMTKNQSINQLQAVDGQCQRWQKIIQSINHKQWMVNVSADKKSFNERKSSPANNLYFQNHISEFSLVCSEMTRSRCDCKKIKFWLHTNPNVSEVIRYKLSQLCWDTLLYILKHWISQSISLFF